MGTRRLWLGVVGATVAIGCLVPSASARDYANVARDIVPSGEYGSVPPPPQASQQALLYDGLTPLFSNVSASDVTRYFKPEPVGTAGAAGPLTTESVPRAGVTIQRDAYDVPYITGVSRDDVTWGAGWIVAEDRGLLLGEARYISRIAALDPPGLDALGLISSLASFTPSAQTEQEMGRQTQVLEAQGAKGQAVLHDVDVYLSGINAYVATHGGGTSYTRNDVYALNALKDQFVGEGGGQQAINSEVLSALRRRLGTIRGAAVWTDLKQPTDPSAPASVPGHVSFQPPHRNESGNILLDPRSFQRSTSAAVETARAERPQASNELMVSGQRSATHHPILVGGPQIGYFYPGLTQEMDLNGPGVHQHGAMAAPFPGYIFIGRSEDQGWTLTSAGLNQIDTYAETLCRGSRHRYIYQGQCRAMQFFDAGKLTVHGKTSEVTFYRTVHGPVIGYGRVHGRLVALSSKRSSYGKDSLDLLFYHDLAHGQIHNVHQFFRAANQTPQTFNSFYLDDKDIGVFTSGLVPIRPGNVNPDLPIDGRGKEEWRGFVSFRNHPQGFDPADGQIVNWNNRPQLGYQAPSDNWMLGAIQRVTLLLNNLGRGAGVTPAKIVGAMNAAATQDVREVTLEPVLSKLLHGGRAPNARDARMLALLDSWHRSGGSRLDRTGNGQITDPGAAIMDTAWPLLARAWASSVLGADLAGRLSTYITVYDQPPGGQYTGWHVWMYKDLRTILGERVTAPFAVRYCGGGNLRRCRNQLWRAIDQAGKRLAGQQGSDPANWHSSANAERIKFVPGLLTTTMRYTNRPSGIQQVLSFAGHNPGDG